MSPSSTSSRTRSLGLAAGLVATGLVAGGVLAGTLTASAATSPSAPSSPLGSSAAAPWNPHPGDPSQPQRPDETLLTGDTAAKVKAAVLRAYPGASFVRVETDSDGVYEAHITKADGTPTTVEVSKAYAVTGEEAMHGVPGAGPQGAPPAGAATNG